MDYQKKSRKNLILVIIAILLISVMCYLGIICTASDKIAKAEKNNYLATTENDIEEKTTNSSSSSSNTSNTSNTSTTTNTEKEKSSNANLSMLGIRPTEYDFTGFKVATTSYDVTVPLDVEEVEVYATAQDSKAKISGLGTKKLTEGLNDLSVVVTAEDGTEKIYTINVTRENVVNDVDTSENTEVSKKGLSSLKIEGVELSPTFDTSVYEYTAKYIGEDTELNIETVATEENYSVEITGNENLKEGENTITIIVSDNKDEIIATYQVIVNKSLVDEEAIAREQEEARKQEEQKKMIIIGGAIVAIILIIVIAIIIKNRRNKAWAEEYTMPFGGLDDNDEEDEFTDNSYQDEENSEEKENTWTKESARKQFLDDYDNIYQDQERASRRKHKGKRFK